MHTRKLNLLWNWQLTILPCASKYKVMIKLLNTVNLLPRDVPRKNYEMLNFFMLKHKEKTREFYCESRSVPYSFRQTVLAWAVRKRDLCSFKRNGIRIQTFYAFGQFRGSIISVTPWAGSIHRYTRSTCMKTWFCHLDRRQNLTIFIRENRLRKIRNRLTVMIRQKLVLQSQLSFKIPNHRRVENGELENF